MKVFNKFVAIALASLMVMNIAPMGLAQAKMVTTDQVLEQSDPASDREKVRNFLLREDVRDQLVTLGIDPQEAESRVSGLVTVEPELVFRERPGRGVWAFACRCRESAPAQGDSGDDMVLRQHRPVETSGEDLGRSVCVICCCGCFFCFFFFVGPSFTTKGG